MARRLKMELNVDAVKKANDEFYAKHPEFIQDGKRIPLDADDPAQAKLREEWVDLYLKHGGELENPPKNSKPVTPVQPCPDCKGKLIVKVLDDDSQPIEGAEVEVEKLGKKETDEDGLADYGEVPAETYDITAAKDGYGQITGPWKPEFEVKKDQVNTAERWLTFTLDDYSSEKSASVLPPKEDVKIVFLTFDDGPEAGTKEVFDLLKELGVPGSFFLVGENATFYENNVDKGFVKKLYNAPSIQVCNHSHTHAHQFYSSFYDTGLKIDAKTLEPDATTTNPARRSVLMDFEYASIAFTEALSGVTVARPADPKHDFRGKLDLSKLKYSRFLHSRMPGSNIWRLPGIKKESGGGVTIRVDEANELESNGYRIFGWDKEFNMSFDIAEKQRKEYEAGRDGHLDLYSADNIGLDRPTTSGTDVFESIKSEFDEWSPDVEKDKKLILLMHERAFRRGPKGEETKFTGELRTLIDLCLKEGFKFDVVKNY